MSLITLAGLNAIETAVNTALKQDLAALQRLSALKGQQILVEVNDINLLLLIQITDRGVALFLPESAQTCLLTNQDTHVKGPVSAFRQLLEGDGFFDGSLRIQGNAQTLMTLHKVMASFELDWEGILADHIGDVPTAFIAPLLRKQWQWSKTTASSLQANTIEYLQEEAQLLPTRIEFDMLVEELESLSTELDRLEARSRFLSQRLKN
ncbi:hypothetical protein CBF23_001190 [Marinomonas agarivorans]|nr:hypothetical protein CBF23_001190 [Marinomonas agarivorans]